eukprot:gene41782-51781_t
MGSTDVVRQTNNVMACVTVTKLSHASIKAAPTRSCSIWVSVTGDEELLVSLRAVPFTDKAVLERKRPSPQLTDARTDRHLCQQVLPDLLNYLRDTSHEKISRSLSLSIAMMVYGKEEGVDDIIESSSSVARTHSTELCTSSPWPFSNAESKALAKTFKDHSPLY